MLSEKSWATKLFPSTNAQPSTVVKKVVPHQVTRGGITKRLLKLKIKVLVVVAGPSEQVLLSKEPCAKKVCTTVTVGAEFPLNSLSIAPVTTGIFLLMTILDATVDSNLTL